MGKPNGYLLVKLGGMERPALVGFEAGSIFCQLQSRLNPETGAAMSLKAYGDLFDPFTDPASRLTPDDYRDFTYAALASGANEDGLPIDFSPRMVGQWMGDAPTEASKPIAEMYRQMTVRAQNEVQRAKNAQAPKPSKAAGRKKPQK